MKFFKSVCFFFCLRKADSHTIWEGDTTTFVGNQNFCNTCGTFGVAGCDFICAGGGNTGGGNGCKDNSPNPCTIGQYTFSTNNGWMIENSRSQVLGKAPYRSFAYLPFCGGKALNTCWDGTKETFSFSFKIDGFFDWGIYNKLLFWTDSFNLLGILPKGAPGASGKNVPGNINLIMLPTTDFPNDWAAIIEIKENVWYKVDIVLKQSFTLSTVIESISVNGKVYVTNKANSVNLSSDNNGMQLGLYSFDFGGTSSLPSSSVIHLYLKDMVFGDSEHIRPTPNASTKSPTRKPIAAPKPTQKPTSQPVSKPTTKLTPRPTLKPVAKPTLSQRPTTRPTRKPIVDDVSCCDDCVPDWGQCGGCVYQGKTACCDCNYRCISVNEYYAQCQPVS